MPAGSGKPVSSLKDLTQPPFERVAIGLPASVPVALAARATILRWSGPRAQRARRSQGRWSYPRLQAELPGRHVPVDLRDEHDRDCAILPGCR